MYPFQKNLCLQNRAAEARIINSAVCLARRRPVIDVRGLESHFNLLTTDKPFISLDKFDLTGRPLAFERLAMPKLRRELRSKDPVVILQVVSTIMDLARSPEKAYEAIKLKIHERLVDFLRHEEPAIRERACMLLNTLANAVDGKLAITKNPNLITTLSLLVDDVEAAVRIKAAKCLEILATFWQAADDLIDFGFIPILLDCVCKDLGIIVTIHLGTLMSLMYDEEGIQCALASDAFPIFMSLLESDNSRLKMNGLSCLSTLLSFSSLKIFAITTNMIQSELSRLLYDERPEIYGAAACVISLMFAKVEEGAIIQAEQIKSLSERLLVICNDDRNPSAKMFAIKALTSISGPPEIKKYVKHNYLEKIKAIKVGDNQELKKCKNMLLIVVNWLPNIL